MRTFVGYPHSLEAHCHRNHEILQRSDGFIHYGNTLPHLGGLTKELDTL